MKLILCLDDHNGMAFNGRRQSMDRVVRARMLELTGGAIRMNDYSFRQFKEPVNAAVSEDFLSSAQPGEWCFAETCDVTPYENEIETLTVFRWNRIYPADLSCDLPDRWTRISAREFVGSSHETVTEEVYIRETDR